MRVKITREELVEKVKLHIKNDIIRVYGAPGLLELLPNTIEVEGEPLTCEHGRDENCPFCNAKNLSEEVIL